MASVRVAVRVRPLNKREKQFSSKVIIHMKGNTTSIHSIKLSPNGGNGLKDRPKTFSYDFSYDSTDKGNPSFASQEKIFQDLGSDVLNAAFEGFNACVFAYGQTGTGKSYTMMGNTGDKGLIPRICEGLFCEISERNASDAVSFRTEVSYLEIYNERVQDLLQKKLTPADGGGLRVREHPRDGPYVESLSKHVVRGYRDVEDLMTTGNGNRTTANTGMNDVSSRSHAIFTISFTQARFDATLPCETLSKIHLVDLAGSERADTARTAGPRLKEGANINKSLVTLGSVISALADLSERGPTAKKKKQIFVPYRDSVLTWLLKDSLGGNSKTIMIATISPADVNYGETLSTLRYASRAKIIVNSPMVNEDSSVKLIRELQAEIARLQGLVEQPNQAPRGDTSSTLKVEERLHQNEAKVLELTKEWTNKWRETQNILKEETLALRKEGSGVVLDSQLPHLIGFDEDLLSTGIILYHLKEGRTLVGCDEASCPQDIVLHGPGVLNEHCVLENCAGTVGLIPQSGALCLVNGMEVTRPCQLTQGAIIQLGKRTIFRFNHPTEAAKLREKRKRGLLSSFSPSMTDLFKSTENLAKVMLVDPGRLAELENVHSCNQDVKRRPKLSAQSCAVDQKRPTEEEEARGRDANEAARGQAGGNEPRYVDGDVGAAGVGDPFRSTVVQLSGRRHSLHETDTDDGKRINVLATVNGDSRLPSSSALSASPETRMTTAIPGKCPVSHSSFESDGDALRGGVSARDGREQERDPSHKSGSGVTSEELRRSAEIGAGVESCGGGAVWSGDASLQQTSVLGPGDGCGVEPEGSANESQGAAADCYEGHPGSGGSSLGSVSHLQSTGGASSGPVLPQAGPRSRLSAKTRGSQAAHRTPEEAALEGRFSRGEMDGSRSLEGIPGECEAETMAVAVAEQNSGLGSLVSRVSWMFHDAGRLLWSSPKVLRQVREEGLQAIGAHWSSQVVSLVKESRVLSVVKDSQVFSLIKESHVFSLVKDSRMFSMVNELPLIQHIQIQLTQNLQTEEDATTMQTLFSLNTKLPVFPTQCSAKAIELPRDQSLVQEENGSSDKCIRELEFQEQDVADIHSKQGQNMIEVLALPEQHSCEPHGTHTAVDKDARTTAEQSSNVTLTSLVTVQSTEGVRVFCQKLVEFPEALRNLQSMPLPSLVDSLRSLIPTSVFRSQKTVALYWLSVAKCSQPLPRPGLLILMESGLYTVTSDPGSLVLFHHLPLVQLKEVHVGLAGLSLRLTGTTEDSVLSLHTHSQKLTQELCRATLGVICPGDGRVSRHPLLHGDLTGMALEWQAYIPDLLLDAGLRVCCQFQKTLADLVYLLHGNMDRERPSMGEVRLLLYTSVGVSVSPEARAEPLARLLLTDTHLGLLQEDTVFHPPPPPPPPPPAAHAVVLKPRRTQFQDVTLRRRSDVRCVLVHDAAGSGGTRLDLILAHAGARGHPERVAKIASLAPQASNSSPQAEVWKLTFSCSAEAGCLINHLSNV
ncbi:uncharacterized protein kif16bb isoform 2-T2 [Polymixia lowei]